MSATHNAFGADAAKSRSTRSGAARPSRSRRVVHTRLRRASRLPREGHDECEAPRTCPESARGSARFARARQHLARRAKTAGVLRTRRSRSGRRPAPCTMSARGSGPDALSGIRTPRRNRIGLLSEPGCGFFQNLFLGLEVLHLAQMARTPARAPRGCGLRGLTPRAGPGTQSGTVNGVSEAWGLLLPKTGKCPPERVNSICMARGAGVRVAYPGICSEE